MPISSRPRLSNPPRLSSIGMDEMLAGVCQMVPMLKRRAMQTEQDRRISPDIIDTVRELGLFRVLQPKMFGGFEYSFTDFVRLMFEMGRGCGSTAWSVSIPMIHNWLVALYPLEAQQEVWDDPTTLVAGAYAPNGTCVAEPGGYRISGRWSFASNCDNSGWFVVCTALPTEAGGGPPILAWFLVPRSEVGIDDTWFSAGMCGTGSKTVVVDAPVFVPAHRVLKVSEINSGEAPGSRVHDNPVYRLTFTGAAPFTLAAVPVGIAIGALEDFIEIARNKMAAQPGGPPRPMAELPQVQLAIAETSAMIDAASSLLLRDAQHMDAKVASGQLPTVDERICYRRDHSYAANQSAKATTLLFEAMGANGGDLSSPIQRAWRDCNLSARHISLAWSTTGALYGQNRLGQPLKGTY